jgi:hypothetical protein
VSAKDKDGKMFQIDKNNPRWTSGELTGATSGKAMLKGKVVAKDIFNNHFCIPINDYRLLSGELVGVNKGKKLPSESYVG